MGTGTVAEASLELGRNVIGYELNEDYIKLIDNKIDKGLKAFKSQ